MRNNRNLSIAASLIAVTLSVVPNATAQCGGFRSLPIRQAGSQPSGKATCNGQRLAVLWGRTTWLAMMCPSWASGM